MNETSSSEISQRAGPVIDGDTVIQALDMFGSSAELDVDDFRRQLESAAQAYLTHPSRKSPAWSARELRGQLESLQLNLEKVLLAIDDLAQENFVIMKEAADKALQVPSPFDKDGEPIPHQTPQQWVGGGWCQTNSNSSQLGQYDCPLCRTKLAPLSESGGAVELEIVARVKVTFLVEMIANGGMY